MKGEALITIKTKDGKVKQQVKQTNLVFDIPKELIKKALSYADMGSYANSYSSDIPYFYNSRDTGYNLAPVMQYQEWFRAIRVNDQPCSTTDFKDFKIPTLCGGEIAKINNDCSIYAYYDTVNSLMNGNVLKKSYTWNDCPAFTIRSINLCHYYNGKNPTESGGIGGYQASKNMYIQNKICWRNAPRYYEENTSSNDRFATNTLYKVGNDFVWRSFNSRRNITKICQLGYNYDTQTSSNGEYFFSPITAAKNNKLLLKMYYNDLSTDYSGAYLKYIGVYDTQDEELKFVIPIEKFDGLGLSSSPSNYYAYYACFIATESGNYLLARGTASGWSWKLYKLPTTYNGTDTIQPLNVDISFITSANVTRANFFVINENIIVFNEGKTFRINSDDTITVYNHIPFNSIRIGNRYTGQILGQTVNRYYDVFRYYTQNFDAWYNTTVLNLSEGVEVSQGDTVTIEYTITAN